MLQKKPVKAAIDCFDNLRLKHFIDHDNAFLKDFSSSKSTVCSAPFINNVID